jgi:hypothetical protein
LRKSIEHALERKLSPRDELFSVVTQFGQKADYYKQNQSDLSHKKLLRDFGANEKLADEMLTDKGIS